MGIGQEFFSKRPFPPLVMNACSLKLKLFVGIPWEKFCWSRQNFWSKEMREREKEEEICLPGMAVALGLGYSHGFIGAGQKHRGRLGPLFAQFGRKNPVS